MEALHPDLIPHVVNGLVHHKLVVASLTKDASSINRTYRAKLHSVKKAETDAYMFPCTSDRTVSAPCSLQRRKD